MEKELIGLLFPKGILEYFEVRSYQIEDGKIEIKLQEKNIVPQEYKGKRVESKGFYKEKVIEDFPIRGHQVHLHIKQRKWQLITERTLIKRDWEITAKGTRMTQEFAFFLKELA